MYLEKVPFSRRITKALTLNIQFLLPSHGNNCYEDAAQLWHMYIASNILNSRMPADTDPNIQHYTCSEDAD
jgi:hypothetical protein